jgi:hypothetical protein
MWKETVLTSYRVLPQYLPERTENQKKSGICVSQSRFEDINIIASDNLLDK